MEFIDKLVLPYSSSSMELFKVFLMLAQMVFLIISGILLGSSILSYYFGTKARKTNNPIHTRLAVDYINLILSRKMILIILSFISFLAILFFYIQLLQNTGSNIVNLFIFSSAFYLLGLSFLLMYQRVANSNEIRKYLRRSDEDNKSHDEISYIDSTLALPGIFTLFAGMWLFVGTVSLTVDYNSWTSGDSIFAVAFSVPSLIKFAQFFTMALSAAGISLIVKLFNWKKIDRIPSKYSEYAQKQALSVALIFAVVQPLFLLPDLMLTPEFTMTGLPFAIVLVSIIALFIFVHLVYVDLKTSAISFSKWAFYLILIIFTLFIIREQVLFDTSSKEQLHKLSVQFEKKK